MRSALIFEERIVTVVKYIFMQFNFELLWWALKGKEEDMCLMKITGLYCILNCELYKT
jgi:hypothetical protein